MTNQEEIVNDLTDALVFLSKEFKSNKNWQCPSNVIDESYRDTEVIVKLESLLCFLLPYFSFSKNLFERPNLVQPDKIERAVEDVVSLVAKSGSLTGHPYTKIEDVDGEEHGFIDSYCFCISAMIYYSRIFGAPRQRARITEFETAFEKCVDFLTDAAVQSETEGYLGFFCTDRFHPDVPNKYSTWMAIETLSDFFVEEDYTDLFFVTESAKKKLVFLVEEVRNSVLDNYTRLYINGKLNASEKERLDDRNIFVYKDIVREDPFDQSAHNNLWIIMALVIAGYKDVKQIEKCLVYLYTFLSDGDNRTSTLKSACETRFRSERIKHIESDEKANLLEDRCFLPQFLKLCILVKERFGDQVQGLDEMIDSSFQWLRNNRSEGSPVWDRYSANNAQWAVYQTERAFEAYIASWRVLKSKMTAEEVFSIGAGLSMGSVPAPKAVDVNITVNGLPLDVAIQKLVKTEVGSVLNEKMEKVAELLAAAPKGKGQKTVEELKKILKIPEM